jgi:4-oxalocrotonate tautomerase
MPTIHVEWLAGRSQEVKNQVAKELTQVLVDRTAVEPGHVYVIFKDVEPQDWAVGGVCFPAKPAAK